MKSIFKLKYLSQLLLLLGTVSLATACGMASKSGESKLFRDAQANDNDTHIIRVNNGDRIKFVLVTRNKGYELSCENPVDLLTLIQSTGYPTFLLDSFPPLKKEDEIVKALKIDEQPLLSCSQGTKVLYKSTLDGQIKYFFATAKGEHRLYQIGCQALADAMKMNVATATDIAATLIDDLSVFSVSNEDDINCMRGVSIGSKVQWEQGADQTTVVKPGMELPSLTFAAKNPDGTYAKFNFKGEGACAWIQTLVVPNALIIRGIVPASFRGQTCTYTITAGAGTLSEDKKVLKFSTCADGTVMNKKGICVAGATKFASHTDLADKEGVIYAPNIFFIDEKTGWMVGEINSDGIIYKSIDGGATWKQQLRLPDNSIDNLKFANPLVGWAIGAGGLTLKTIDGGENWIPQETGNTEYTEKLEVADENHVWIAGWKSVLRTVNGGKTWEKWNLPTALSGISAMDFVDAENGFLLTTTYSANQTPITQLMMTNDSGENWSNAGAPIVNANYPLLNAVSATSVWIAGWNGLMQYTSNAGQSWSESRLPGTAVAASSMSFLDERTGYLLQGPNLFFTKDGGKVWKSLGFDASNFYTLFTYDAAHVYLIGTPGNVGYSVP